MPVPVILDTDIGFDVDDVWALAFMLRCPELDVKLVTTNTGRYRILSGIGLQTASGCRADRYPSWHRDAAGCH